MKNIGSGRGLASLRGGFGKVAVDGRDADLGAGFALHAHIRLRVAPLPHDDHRQPWRLHRFNNAMGDVEVRMTRVVISRESDAVFGAAGRDSIAWAPKQKVDGASVLTRPAAAWKAATSAATSARTAAATAPPSRTFPCSGKINEREGGTTSAGARRSREDVGGLPAVAAASGRERRPVLKIQSAPFKGGTLDLSLSLFSSRAVEERRRRRHCAQLVGPPSTTVGRSRLW